jgi:hypothetical protein
LSAISINTAHNSKELPRVRIDNTEANLHTGMSEAAAWWTESSALLKQRLTNLSVAEDLSIMVLVEAQIKGLRLGESKPIKEN